MKAAILGLLVVAAAGFAAGAGWMSCGGKRAVNGLTEARLRSVTRRLFITTQRCALIWVFISYGIAIYSTVRLQQVYTLAELSEPAIRTILGVSILKVVENIFEHNDGTVWGKSQKTKNVPESGAESDL